MIGGLGFGEVVFVLIVVLVLFGPNKLPELARAVGGAMGEFKTAQKAAEFDLSGFDELNRENAEKKKQETAALNDKIIKMAEDAGISTEGKTTDELLVLISGKMNENSDAGNSNPENSDFSDLSKSESDLQQ
ncbi:Sec-independent protein translocase protein TatA [Methanimicrococcus sp. At1]|uniref:Sec-independent protein translocase protein TatA n=1 Tax=Methanimicrococcus hacksteinii TaxID=3028293 RepID=A0ABU3VMS7_9EURY|nr:twin-arginine translocase TatA/TatE family subunit [Methanimicrococcus sp. At1]MDV0444706.1 Sec-independent protein translocase protein TatA [Methanimicrococcus sp. At1]